MAMEYNETILIVMIVVAYLGVHIIKARFMHCQYTVFNMKIRVERFAFICPCWLANVDVAIICCRERIGIYYSNINDLLKVNPYIWVICQENVFSLTVKSNRIITCRLILCISWSGCNIYNRYNPARKILSILQHVSFLMKLPYNLSNSAELTK